MRFFSVFFVILPLFSYAQVTIRITKLPIHTPSNTTLFLASSINNWNAGDSNYIFTKIDSVYQIVLPIYRGTIQYKITQGNWALCEATSTGQQSANRIISYSSNLVENIEVAGWETSQVISTALPNVKIVSNTFWIPQFNKSRRVWIYLPSDYETPPFKRYPVLYMQDGQNVFDAATSHIGEWGVDETLAKKELKGIKGCIVVAIDHDGANRLNEYSPFVNDKQEGGDGNAYLQFLATTLKMFIDSAYRTMPQREYTGIAGSSMGGLISFYASLQYPMVYSKVGVFSPAFSFSDSIYSYVASKQKQADTKFYFIAGQNESLGLVSDMDSMVVLLKAVGFSTDEIISQVKADGAHSEWFWRREFGTCFDWLYTDITEGIKNRAGNNWQTIAVYPNPAIDSFSISPNKVTYMQLVNESGKEVSSWRNIEPNTAIDVSRIKAGKYILRIKTASGVIDKKLIIK